MSEATASPLYFASRAAFRAWAAAQPSGRFERIDGEVVTVAPERVAHVRIKARVWRALEDALQAAEAPCEALGDGVTIEIDDMTDFEPDALVNCGQILPDDTIAAPNPVIVVDVLSPGTRHVDTGRKLAGYSRVSSIQHYLIVNPLKAEIVHHKRNADGNFLTKIITAGSISLDPPGLTLHLDQIYRNRG